MDTGLCGEKSVDKIILPQHIGHDGHACILALEAFYDWVEETWGKYGSLLDSGLELKSIAGHVLVY